MAANTPQHDSSELRSFEVTIPTADGVRIAERISIMVPMRYDADLEEWLITPEAQELIDDTKARHMGLLLPNELKSLREQLCLTQDEIADLLKIGRKSWTRWESGKQRPSQSTNLFLRALQTGKLSIYDLQWLNNPQTNWMPAVEAAKQFKPDSLLMSFANLDEEWTEPTCDTDKEQQPLAA